MRLPDLRTLDVRVERRIARVTIDNNPINLMDATLLGELDQLVSWLAEQGDSVRVVIFQSAIPEFFLAHLDLGLIQAIVDDPDPDVALESFQGLVARYRQLDQVTIAKVGGRVGGGGSVAPGFTDTEMNDWFADPAAKAWAASQGIQGRVGQPDDIGDIIAFLASEDARWINGQVLDATGGGLLGVSKIQA
jgi:hypothetical protein